MDLEQKAYCNITYTHPETNFGLARSDQLHAVHTKEDQEKEMLIFTTTTEIIQFRT